MLTAVIAFSVSGSAPADPTVRAGETPPLKDATGEGAVQRCPDYQRGLVFYRARYVEWTSLRGVVAVPSRMRHPRNRAKMGAGQSVRLGTDAQGLVRLMSCPRVRHLAARWRTKAYAARRAYERWVDAHTLRDPEVRPGNRAWEKAVQRVQLVFPGTASWLWSCSAAEGGHGRWVGFGGQRYSTWLRDSDTVGGPLQFRWSTFKGMYRRALDHVRARGYRVPPHLRDPGDDRSWRSMLGQALAGGWARWSGSDDGHWSASWQSGCR